MSESSIPQLPARGDLLLLTDELAAPADFLLYRSLAAHLKTSGKSAKCVVLSASGNLGKWKAMLAKSNVNLSALINTRAVTFLDLSSTHLAPQQDQRTALRPVFDEFKAALEGGGEGTLVVVDDLSTLEWIGVPSQEVARFARAVCALCRKQSASLVIRHHIITPSEPDDLLRLLLQLCTLRVDVFPLSSGRSGSVNGQVALHAGPAQIDPTFRPIPRSKALLYRLTDASSVFFERGTGAGVL